MDPFSTLKKVFDPSQPSRDSPLNNVSSSAVPQEIINTIEQKSVVRFTKFMIIIPVLLMITLLVLHEGNLQMTNDKFRFGACHLSFGNYLAYSGQVYRRCWQ